MSLTKDKGREVLLETAFNGKSYAQNVYEFWLESFDETIEKFGQDRHIHGPSVYAVVMWSYMVGKIKRFAIRDSQEAGKKTRVINYNKMVLLVLDDKVALRFKKIDRHSLQTKNNVTDQVAKFKSQTLELEEESQIVYIDAGYRLNQLGTSIDEMFFVCPKNLWENHWAIALHELGLVTPQMPIFDVREEDVVPVVRVKPNVKKSDGESQSDEQKAG